jgi:diguanylate cyclase (GGDEF)-like protein
LNARGVSLGSFKVKLGVYFLVLSLLPAAAALWGFASASAQSEQRRVDTRLQAGLRVALTSLQERGDSAATAAQRFASMRAFQIALERQDRAEIVALLRTQPMLAVEARQFGVGRIPPLAIHRQADVITGHGLAGTVVASVPLDAPLVRALRSGSGLDAGDPLALVYRNRIVAASPPLSGTLELVPGQVARVKVDGVRYRALESAQIAGVGDVRFAVLSPQSAIDAADSSSRDRLLAGLLVGLLIVAFVAYLEGRSILLTLRGFANGARAIAEGRLNQRVDVRGRDEFASLGVAFNDMADQLEARLADLDTERERLRGAFARFGEALAAHDREQLLQVIVETAVEATGASGATLHTDGLVATAGLPSSAGETLVYGLTVGTDSLGTLELTGHFDDEDRVTAASLATQAAIALQNARLQAIVERQALVDGLTGIANRRQCEDALAHEIARSDRLGSPFTLVVADLDDFKAVNDRHGHAVGDDVLREFASVLRLTVREADLAGRWGGEEFVLLLPGTEEEGGALLAERVRAALGERSFHGRDGAVFGVTCSFGVAQLRQGGSERELFAQADRALYEAKRHGKNRIERSARIRAFE